MVSFGQISNTLLHHWHLYGECKIGHRIRIYMDINEHIHCEADNLAQALPSSVTKTQQLVQASKPVLKATQRRFTYRTYPQAPACNSAPDFEHRTHYTPILAIKPEAK